MTIINRLVAAGILPGREFTVTCIVIAAVFVINMILYVAYYRMEEIKAFYAAMVPLITEAAAMAVLILGTYSVDPVFGNQIVLYYGSFVASLGNAGEQVYRARIRETVRHEFLHHLENLAGLNKKGSLAEEDARRMLEYYKSHAPK